MQHFRVFHHVGFFCSWLCETFAISGGEEVETAADAAVQMFLLALACTRGQVEREWTHGNQSQEMDV